MKERAAKIGSLVPTQAPAAQEIGAGPVAVRRRSRCRVALATGSADHLTQETVCQLRHRLGIASLIALVPLAFFRHSRSLWLSLNYLLTSTDELEDDEEVEAPRGRRIRPR